MKELIEALTIFAKHTNASRPTYCEQDTLFVLVDPSAVDADDKTRLLELGFVAQKDRFYSYRFGIA